MLPRRQNERSLQKMEMEEMGRQIQQPQETVNFQQAILEAQQRIHSHRRQLQMNDIKVDILDFEGNLQPDDFLD